MSVVKELDKLEEKYDIDEPASKEELIGKLVEMHNSYAEKGADKFSEFASAVLEYFAGTYIPYVFWVELARYMDDESARNSLYACIDAFSNSGFETAERKKMKPLLITYFAMEKEFETDKIQTLIIEKAHPDVQEYFRKITNFVEKNKTSVDMYVEKFEMLRTYQPDFDLLKVPLLKLKERLGVAE